jgi:hypothetical protein
MATRDSLHRPPTPAQSTIFVNRIDGILAARGIESALSTKESPQGGPIEHDDLDQQPAHWKM